jgi:hypothetical protein
MTTLGGKAGRAPASWLFVQAGQALVEKPLPPLANDLALETEARGDDVVPQAVGSHENNLRADDISVRRRILGRPLFEGRSFVASERDGERASSRHVSRFAATVSVLSETGGVKREIRHRNCETGLPSGGSMTDMGLLPHPDMPVFRLTRCTEHWMMRASRAQRVLSTKRGVRVRTAGALAR